MIASEVRDPRSFIVQGQMEGTKRRKWTESTAWRAIIRTLLPSRVRTWVCWRSASPTHTRDGGGATEASRGSEVHARLLQ